GDATIEAPGAQNGGIEHIGPVGGGDDDDALVGLEPVHLHEQLIERLLAFVVSAAEPGTAMPAHRVDLVDEDDARSVLLALLEQVANTACAHAYEHLDEVGTRDAEEGHAGLAGDGPRQQRLARSRRAHHQHTLRNTAAQLLELLRVLEERDDLLELVFGLVDACNVGEGDLVL